MPRGVYTDRFTLSDFPRGKYIMQSNVNCASVHSATCKVISFEALYVTNKQTNKQTSELIKYARHLRITTRIKPTSAYGYMRIYYITDIVSLHNVSATYCDHLQGGYLEGYVTKSIKTNLQI